MAKFATVRTLASTAGVEPDEALVLIWDAGLDAISDADQRLSAAQERSVLRALGSAAVRDMLKITFWMNHWGLSRADTVERLREDYNIIISGQARTLPPGALRKLRRAESNLQIGEREHPVPSPVRSESQEPLIWNLRGRKKDVLPLSVGDICSVHHALVAEFESSGDPIDPSGVRDQNLLESAASRPLTANGYAVKYDTIEGHAAALLHSLVHNHPFFNGNKRTALVSMMVLLDRNGLLLTCDQEELFRKVLLVAQHRIVEPGLTDRSDREVLDIAGWVCENSRPIQKGDHVLTWRELRRILQRLDCEIGSPMPGNKIAINRRTRVMKRFGRRSEISLHVTTGYRNEGSEVGRKQLSVIRRELRLSEEDGYDADYFYGNDPREPDAFIAEYRVLLKRLAKL